MKLEDNCKYYKFATYNVLLLGNSLDGAHHWSSVINDVLAFGRDSHFWSNFDCKKQLNYRRTISLNLDEHLKTFRLLREELGANVKGSCQQIVVET